MEIYGMKVIWQDIVLMIGSFIFAIALIPSITSKSKPSSITCLLTAMVLAAFGICYATLGLWLAVGSTTLTFAGWIILYIQSLRKH